MLNWMKDNEDDLILSSRVRLARNIQGIPFPNRLNNEGAKEVIKKVEEGFYNSIVEKEDFNTNYLWENTKNENVSLLERHLISMNLMNTPEKSAFICNKDETTSIMINEEDHIRFQAIDGGLNIREAYKNISKMDDLLEEAIDFSFDENLGYITCCPTNLGTAMRASVMVHLPALSLNNEINNIFKALTQVGMTIRGLYGEGSKGEGNIYQISNQITLGVSEEDIINNIEAITSQLVNQEKELREKMMSSYKNELEDKIYRSLGILQNSRILNTKEALDMMSNVRMGVEMGIIKDIQKSTLNELLISIQPATLQIDIERELTSKERDIERARIVRETLR